MNGWLPPDNGEPFFGFDRTRTPERFKPGPPWRWYHHVAWRVGNWLEDLGRRLQALVP